MQYSKTLIIVSLALWAGVSLGAENTPAYKLDWKVGEQRVAYKIKTYIQAGKNKTGFGSIFNQDKLTFKIPPKSSYTVLMKARRKNVIGVDFYQDPLPPAKKKKGQVDKKANFMRKLMQRNAGKVVLAGEVSSSGKIESFWLPAKQKNMLAMYFQLPSGPVGVGQSWELSTNLLNFSGKFTCSECRRVSRITLVSVKKNAQGDSIAKLAYNISEKLKGKSSMGELDWLYSIYGTGFFNVTQGRWQKQVLKTKALLKGSFMQSDMEIVNVLTFSKDIPKAYLK